MSKHRIGVGVALGGNVALDREGELGEVAVADDAPELGFGLEHPGSGPAQAPVAGLPTLDVAANPADGLDQRLARVRRKQRALQAAADAEARPVALDEARDRRVIGPLLRRPHPKRGMRTAARACTVAAGVPELTLARA